MMSAQLQQPEKAGAKLPAPENNSSNTATAPEATQPKPAGLNPLKNRVRDSKSPYVRAHSDSLVAWQLLDDDAISRAKKENKLIFLSIGFLASHYCHLTRQESFSNPKVASILNENFVPVVIDREERPDIDNIYMSYNQSLSGSGGWPLNVFLTPELEPVFSGTYWAAPGVQDDGEAENDGVEKPLDWLIVIKKVLASWLDEESRVREEAKKMVVELSHLSAEGTLNHAGSDFLQSTSSTQVESATSSSDQPFEVYGEVDLDQIEEAYERITRTFDPMFGGFGRENKFLTPAKLSLLLRATRFPKVVQDVVGPNDCKYISGMGLHTLRRIANGAVHDHIGGGFHRYSVTRDWSLPAFEKMLIDNALLLGLFLDAWLLSGGSIKDGEFADVVTEVADYITSDRMLSPKGGFFTSEAADSYNRKGDKVMQNGAYYLWTRKEFDAIVGDEQDSAIAAAYWNVQEHGNVDREYDPHDEFLNQNVLSIVKNSTRLSKQLGISENEVEKRIKTAKAKLRSHRQKERVHPVIDTKIVTAYNGMAIAALARTASALISTGGYASLQGQKYLEVAKNAARFIKNELWNSNKILYRVYSDGQAYIEAFAEDYAMLIEGLIELYEATAEETWLEWADELQQLQIQHFYDNPTPTPTMANARCGAFYSTALGAPYTLLRIKDAMDTSQPSVNAVSVSNLFRLGGLLGDEKYTYLAKESVNAFGVEMLEHPNLFPGLLCGIIPWKLGGQHWLAVGAKPAPEQLKAYYRAPRAALFTLRYHAPEKRDAWINKRDPRVSTFPREQGVYNRSPNGTYRKLSPNDLLAADLIQE
ncbi:uncharacterized protein F4812DRAFT_408956 [Daldinia caldariorum]|uniref:uncharacterized protein n=1 Tax=Daldinia caldariorum TaxID=326644 RepID=UPI0020086C5A|nr:uncharacterized protein F4812DRAFT_408956 [Daldinia caldariorum]KAI1472450.1 hypothetical protein F4812DRAFT_408956 [Daldinia caldariorum]